MATARIMLSGIRASGRHGANPGEQLEAQEFVVDLDLSVELHGDDIDSTTDYRAIADEARRAIENGSYQLLETLAEEVARPCTSWRASSASSPSCTSPARPRTWAIDDVSLRGGHCLKAPERFAPSWAGLEPGRSARAPSPRRRAAEREEGVRVLRSSRVYETAPVGPPQPDYLNAVIEVETSLAPRLLLACLGVEQTMGRVRDERWGPRVIDVDS